MGFYPPSSVQQRARTPRSFHSLFSPLGKQKGDYRSVFLSHSFVHILFFSPLPFPACVLLPPVSVGLRQGAEASLTGVWVLITHVCALISSPQLPASSLLHASEWGYISLSL